MQSMIYVLIGIVVLFLIVALAIASFAGVQLEETYRKYNAIPNNKKITGGQFALAITNGMLNSKIKVARTAGELNDAYSPRAKTVVLSEATCDVASVASLTVVSHEFGHAMQDLENTKKFKLNKTLMKVTRILGVFMMPLAIVGIFLCLILSDKFYIGLTCLVLGFLIFVLALILKLISIPLERDASKRGLKLLQDTDALDEEELAQAKDLLKSALYTYIGDFLRAILWWTFLTRKTKLF